MRPRRAGYAYGFLAVEPSTVMAWVVDYFNDLLICGNPMNGE